MTGARDGSAPLEVTARAVELAGEAGRWFSNGRLHIGRDLRCVRAAQSLDQPRMIVTEQRRAIAAEEVEDFVPVRVGEVVAGTLGINAIECQKLE